MYIFCFQARGQNTSKEDFQKNRFDLGMSFLLKGKNEKAIGPFNHAYQIIPNNELGQIAFKKYDSLRPIIREGLRNIIIGNWKKIHKEANWVMVEENGLVGEMITINENNILFFELYKNAKEWCLVKTEPIVFCKKADNERPEIDYHVSFTEFTFINKEVWQFRIDENSGLLNTNMVGTELDNGVAEIISGSLSHQYFKLE